jgi:hypothetical protein
MQSVGNQPTFQRYMWPPYAGSKGKTRNLHEEGRKQVKSNYVSGNVSLPGRRTTFNRLHDVISQKREIFIIIVVICEVYYFNLRKLELSSNIVRDSLVTLSSP